MMSIFILVKLVAIGCSMSFVLRKWFPELSGVMHIAFVLLYVFSGFTMQNYYADIWMNISFLFPLVVYTYFELVNNRNEVPYVIVLTITCMLGVTNTYMVLLFLLIMTGMLPLFNKEYKKCLVYVFRSTITSILLSAWITVPGFIQIFNGGRAMGNGEIFSIWNSVWIFYTGKWMKLLNLCIPLSIFAVYAFRNRKQKGIRFFGIIILLLGLPIVLESINLIWAGGSYESYPVRHAYMLSFWGVVAGVYAYSRDIWNENVGSLRKCLEIGGVVALLGITLLRYDLLNADVDVDKKNVSCIYLIVIIGITIAISMFCYLMRSKRYSVFMLLIVIVQAATLGIVNVTSTNTIDDSYIAMSNMVYEEGHSNDLIFQRIKNLDINLSHNYPIIMGRSASANYMASESKEKLEAMNKLGYAKVGYRISDYGGTLFSDCLLGFKNAISSQSVNENLYQYESSFNEYNVYKCNYFYNKGIRIKKLPEEKEYSNPLEYQNAISKCICGQEFFEIYRGATDKDIQLELAQHSVIYVFADNIKDARAISVTDGKTNNELQISRSGWQNGIQELGLWEEGTVTVHVETEKKLENLVIAVLPMDLFVDNQPEYFEKCDVVREKQSISIHVSNGAGGEWLFLPLYNDAGWNCEVNGQSVEVQDFAEIFMAIPLEEGENEIQLSYSPTGQNIGIILAVIGIVLLVWIIITRKGCRVHNGVNEALWWCDRLAFGIIIIIVYVFSMLFFIKRMVELVLG